MRKIIVTTTINPPTTALKKYVEIAKRDGWLIYIVGDIKTPHRDYAELQTNNPHIVRYFSPAEQIEAHPNLSDLIGWNCIQRRNIGFIEAYRDGAEYIATVDDDNIPLENWGKDILANSNIGVDYVVSQDQVFDPLRFAGLDSETRYWHRGYPVQLLHKEKPFEMRQVNFKPMIQANLWNGNPDIDAICRITHNPTDLVFTLKKPMTANVPMPFNSQNTILHRSVFPDYFLFPHIGRMDDIWAAYFVQIEAGHKVVFAEPTVWQERNDHNLVTDLEAEMIGYKYTEYITKQDFSSRLREVLPERSLRAFGLYREKFI